jgi:hypothetical protein
VPPGRLVRGAGKKRKRKVKGEKRKGKKGKNGLSNFLKIVIDNLYLLYYY